MFSLERTGKELAKYGFVNKYGKPYPKKRIEDILKNLVYVGKVTHGDDIFDGIHEPIISSELFYRVQLMFNSTRKTRTHNEQFVYSNYIQCAKCNCHMIGILKHGAHNSGDYVYYHCSNYKKAHKKEKNIRQDLIDEAMQEVIESFDIPDSNLKNMKKQILDAVGDIQAYEHKSIDELNNQYKKITDIISNGVKQKISGKLEIDDSTFNELYRKWQREKDEISHKISNLSADSKDTMTRMNILTDFANRLPEIYLKATFEEKRLIITTITDSIIFDEESNKLSVKLKPIFEHLRQLKLQKKQAFSADIETLSGTLQTRSKSAKQALHNMPPEINHIKDYGTRKRLLNTKIEPNNKALFNVNVDGGT